MNEAKTEQKAFPPSVVPGATIFLASVCVMMVEIVAGRLAARHIGSSLYTWTAVIGVILGGITLGYYIGGRLADSLPARKTIGWLLAASSGACIAAIILNNLVGEWTFLWRMEMAQRVLCHIAIVFFIPSMLMGAISPVAVKMALESKAGQRADSGQDVCAWRGREHTGDIFGGLLAYRDNRDGQYAVADDGDYAGNGLDIPAESRVNAYICRYGCFYGGSGDNACEMGGRYRFGNVTEAGTQAGYAV